MKKILLLIFLHIPLSVSAYSIRDLRQAISISDLDKVQLLVKKLEMKYEERMQCIEFAEEMVNYRKSSFKISSNKTSFIHQEWREIAIDVGTYILPVLGLGLCFFSSDIPKETIRKKLFENRLLLERAYKNTAFLSEKRANGRSTTLLEDFELRWLLSFFTNRKEHLDSWLAFLESMSKRKEGLQLLGTLAIAAGPVLWFVKRRLAKIRAKSLDDLYKNAIEIKNLLYTVKIKPS